MKAFTPTLIHLDETTSTNTYLKNLQFEENFKEGLTIIAQYQNAGKGQTGNSWHAKKGENLTFSLLLKPTFLAPEYMFLVSKTVSLGIIQFLKTYNDQFKIKWPNDIYFNDSKIGGILVENQLLGSSIAHSIIGIGININQTDFSQNIPNPISLKQIIEKTIDIETFANKLIESINHWYAILQSFEIDTIESQYFESLYRKDGFFKFKAKEETFTATILSVDPDGQLVLETAEGILKQFYFKEVAFII